MSRPLRLAPSNIVQHVTTRAIEGQRLFESAHEFEVFEGLLAAGLRRFAVDVFSYALLPNHVHLACRPRNGGALSLLLKDVKQRFARKWRKRRGTTGRGHVFQGRFTSHLVQTDSYFLTLCQYIARNAVRHGYVDDPQSWRWMQDGHSTDLRPGPASMLTAWPVDVPEDWSELIRAPLTEREISALAESERTSVPFGDDLWARRMSRRLGVRTPHAS